MLPLAVKLLSVLHAEVSFVVFVVSVFSVVSNVFVIVAYVSIVDTDAFLEL